MKQSFHSHQSSTVTPAKTADISNSEIPKNLNIYELIKLSIQQQVVQGDSNLDLNELNDFIKEALIEAQKLKELESIQNSPQTKETVTPQQDDRSSQHVNSLSKDSPILEQIEDFPNHLHYISNRSQFGGTETEQQSPKPLERSRAERPGTTMDQNKSYDVVNYGSLTQKSKKKESNPQKRLSMNNKIEKRNYDTKARDAKSEDRLAQSKNTFSQSPSRKNQNKKPEPIAHKMNSTTKKKRKIKDNSELRIQKSDLNADLHATMRSHKPAVSKITTKLTDEMSVNALTPPKVFENSSQICKKESTPDQVLTPQPKNFGRRKKSNSNSNIKSPKPPIYRYENAISAKPYHNLNDDLVSLKSNKTQQQKYENKISNTQVVQHQNSDSKNKNLTDRISSIANSTKYDNTSVSASTISKEIINVMKLSERNKELIKKFQKGPSRKKLMNLAIAHLNGSNLDEFSRIKKPLKQAQIIGKMLCIFLCAFRPQYLPIHTKYQEVETEFEKWDSIQYFLCNNPTKVLLEINQLKQKVKQLSNFNIQILTGILESIAANESHLKNIPNKNLKSIFDVIHRTLIYIDFKHIRNFDREQTPKETDTSHQNLPCDDSKSYIVYSNYNDVQSEQESDGFNRQINFTSSKFDEISSQKQEKPPNKGNLKCEIYSAISSQKGNQNKSSSKQTPIKAYTPLLPNRRSSQSSYKRSAQNETKPKFTEEKPKKQISILNQIVKQNAAVSSHYEHQIRKQTNKSPNQQSQKILTASLIKSSSKTTLKTPRSTSQTTKVEKFMSPGSQSNLMQYNHSRKQLQQSQSTQQIPFVKKQYSETTATTKKSSSKDLSPTARLIKFKNKTHFQKIVKNAIQSTPMDYSSHQVDAKSDDPLCDLQIFEANMMMRGEDPALDSEKNTITPKSTYQFEQNNPKDMFSEDVKISESSSKYDDEKQDVINSLNPPIQLFQHSSQYGNVEESFQIKLLKVESYHSSKDDIEEIEDLSKKYGIMILDSSKSNKKVDMNTIEELKMRRTMSREKGECLAYRRDETIKKIQHDMMSQEGRR